MLHATFTAPSITALDTFGGREDLVKHKNGAILVEKGSEDKSALMFSVGEIVQIGRAWKVIDGPAVGAPTGETEGPVDTIPKAIQALVDQLIKIKPANNLPAGIVAYHLERAAILEKCVELTKGAEQYPWLKQLVDAYQGAVETDTTQKAAMDRLTAWKDAVLKSAPNETHPYVVFRHATAESAVKYREAKDADKPKVQEAYRDSLEAFVKAYPTAADAPEAVMRLAMAHEYLGKDGEAKAKIWYEKLAKDYPTHAYAAKATGAVKRLGSEGQAFTITGTDFNSKAFNATQLAGKPTIVFYWATWGGEMEKQLTDLGELAKGMNAAMKGVQIVTICLDEAGGKQAAIGMLQKVNLPGTHLYAEGGLDGSPLATAYGIQMVPHIFLVDAAGKVANRNAQGGPVLKDEVEKMLK
jgi:hypothetical protein